MFKVCRRTEHISESPLAKPQPRTAALTQHGRQEKRESPSLPRRVLSWARQSLETGTRFHLWPLPHAPQSRRPWTFKGWRNTRTREQAAGVQEFRSLPLQLYCAHKSAELIETQVWIGLSGGPQESVSLISLQMTAREGLPKMYLNF